MWQPILISSVLISTLNAVAAPRLNLVAIVTDDQADWTMGCYGSAQARTPNLDQLARDGVRFTNAFAVCPVCSPSRASYLTGRHGIEIGITDFIAKDELGIGLPRGILTWPQVLRNAGYRTALVGKWHLGTEPEYHPTQHGFDHFFGNLGGGWPPKNPTFEVKGQERQFQGFSVDILTDEVIRWMRERDDRPFAICVHYREPHAPYAPNPLEDERRFLGFDPSIPDFPGLNAVSVKKNTKDYLTAVAAIDRNVGRILDEIDRLAIADRTAVMFTSDHGYNLGHHGVQYKGNAHWIVGGIQGPKRPNMWETSIRVPLIVRCPGQQKTGAVVSDTVRNIDTFATVCGLLGVSAPADTRRSGQDFSPLIRGQTIPDWDQDVYGAYDLHNGGLAYMRMIRTPQYKLVRHLKARGMDELYDLKADPNETVNLMKSSQAVSIRNELDAKLRAWRQTIGDPVTDH